MKKKQNKISDGDIHVCEQIWTHHFIWVKEDSSYLETFELPTSDVNKL